MGAFCKLVDATLFVFFLIIAIVAPLIDAQTCLPQHLFPSFLVELKSWYATEYGDYLVSEKPHFFVGIVWLELLFQWPLSIACLYGIVAGRSWLNTTCLIYGVSVFTSMPLAGIYAKLVSQLVIYYKITGKPLILSLPLFEQIMSFSKSHVAGLPKVTILSEMTLSKRASDKLMMMYFPFLGFGLLAFLRGLTARTVKSMTIGKRPALNKKKKRA